MSDVRQSIRSFRPGVAMVLLSGLLAACGGVKIKPEPNLPKALVTPIPAKVGIVIPEESRKFVHKETRWGVNWEIDLGPGHTRMVNDVFRFAFQNLVPLKSLDAAKGAGDLKAVFEPLIEQYSFVTARETGGRYYAVTIRYRINLYTPEGELADSYTLTGYGNALAKGLSSGKPLENASIAAMRDAAAKFLVQFPEQAPAKRLARNEPIVVEQKAATASDGIEAVPIIEEGEDASAAINPPVTVPPAIDPEIPIPRS